MVDYDQAVNYILKYEGGLSDNPNDAGGITNMGISFRFLKALENPKRYGFDHTINEDDIRQLTLYQAKAIYYGEFWQHAPFDRINNQAVVNYLFDIAINSGIATAIKMAQRSCWAIAKDRAIVLEDGIMGNATIDAINHCSFFILPVLRSERAAFYRLIVERNPSQQEFLMGWLKRAYQEV
jgi:lysozyme family protein